MILYPHDSLLPFIIITHISFQLCKALTQEATIQKINRTLPPLYYVTGYPAWAVSTSFSCRVVHNEITWFISTHLHIQRNFLVGHNLLNCPTQWPPNRWSASFPRHKWTGIVLLSRSYCWRWTTFFWHIIRYLGDIKFCII